MANELRGLASLGTLRKNICAKKISDQPRSQAFVYQRSFDIFTARPM